MGLLLDKPKTNKSTECGECFDKAYYSFSDMQGWRTEMEDAHIVVTSSMEQPDVDSPPLIYSFFAVLDGHAGTGVSWYCSHNFIDELNSQLKQQSVFNSETVSKALKETLSNIDDRIRTLPEIAKGQDKSGSTFIGCLVTADNFYFVNLGDSRAILVKDGNVCFSTTDHKPQNPLEYKRIVNAGGSVMIQRVNGALAVSRALGDFEYKEDKNLSSEKQMVSNEADITVLTRHKQKDQFIAIACDGVWDVMTNDDVCDFVLGRIAGCTEDPMNALQNAANELLDKCLWEGSRDNMSVVLVAFPNAFKKKQPTVPNAAPINRNAEINIKNDKILDDDDHTTEQQTEEEEEEKKDDISDSTIKDEAI